MATDEYADHPLLSLPKEQQQQIVDVVQNGNIDKLAESTGLSRRQLLQAGIALAVGTTAGGITAQELIQEAQAAASTTDSDGNVGLPGDRVDGFFDGVDANSVNTGNLTDGGGVSHSGEIADASDVPSTAWEDAGVQVPEGSSTTGTVSTTVDKIKVRDIGGASSSYTWRLKAFDGTVLESHSGTVSSKGTDTYSFASVYAYKIYLSNDDSNGRLRAHLGKPL